MNRQYPYIKAALAILIGLNLLITVSRLFIGIDYNYEMISAGEAQHLLMGGHPFADELNPHQMASVMVAPLLLLYKFVSADLTGFVVFIRMLLALLLFMVVYKYARKMKSSLTSHITLGLVLLNFLPYRTHGFHFLYLTYFFGVLFVFVEQFGLIQSEKLKYFALGLLSSLLWLTYLSLFPVILIFAVGLLVQSEKRRKSSVFYLFGVLFGFLPAIYFIAGADGESFRQGFETSGASLFSWIASEKLIRFLQNVVSESWLISGLAISFILTKTGLAKWRFTLLPFITALTCFLFYFFPNEHDSSTEHLSLFWGLFIFGLGLLDENVRRKLKPLPVTFLICTAFALSGSSTFLGINGLAWAFVILAAVTLFYFCDTAKTIHHRTLILITALIYVSTHNLFKLNYFENKNVLVKSGPFAGLFTTDLQSRHLSQVTDLLSELNNDQKLFVFYNFPAGYLLTGAAPWTASAGMPFVQSNELTSEVARYFEKNGFPQYVLRMKFSVSRYQQKMDLFSPDLNSLADGLMGTRYTVLKENETGLLYKLSDK
jgi:hypothetical protein